MALVLASSHAAAPHRQGPVSLLLRFLAGPACSLAGTQSLPGRGKLTGVPSGPLLWATLLALRDHYTVEIVILLQ